MTGEQVDQARCTVGRVVHLAEANHCHAAFVVRVHATDDVPGPHPVALAVFDYHDENMSWLSVVNYHESGQLSNTWHWPRECPNEL